MNNCFTRKQFAFPFFCLIFFSASFTTAFSQITYSNPATPIEFSASVGAGLAQVSDFDSDGDVDVFMMSAVGGGISYFQNNGSGSFSTPGSGNPFSSFTGSTPAGFTASPASTYSADFDNDGDLDIWCRINGAANDIYLKNISGTYSSSTPPVEFSAATGSGLVQIGDYDSDGDIDVFLMSAVSGGITYYQNNGTGTFTTPGSGNPFTSFTASTPAGFTASPTVTYSADFDNDGDVDIWCRINGAANDIYLVNNSGVYSVGTPLIEYSAATGSGLCQIGDYDGDGDIDAIIMTAIAGGITYYQNNGSGVFTTPGSGNPFSSYTSSTPAGFTASPSVTCSADFDNDGDFDIWCRQNNAGNDIYFLAGGSAPSFISSVPANNAAAVTSSSNIVLTFSEAMFAGSGNIYIRKFSDNSIAHTIAANGARVIISSNVVTIDPVSNLNSGTAYYITFDKNALMDASGVIFGRVNHFTTTRFAETRNSFLKFTTNGTLPLTLLNFSGQPGDYGNQLQWKTVNEVNTERFEIEKSFDNAVTFARTGSLAAKSNGGEYRFTDKNTTPGITYYYRLKMVDRDGRFTYSPTISITAKNKSENQFVLYPNPVIGSIISVQALSPVDVTLSIKIVDMKGSVSYTGQLKTANARFEIPVQSLSPGSYLLQITSADGTNQTLKFRKE